MKDSDFKVPDQKELEKELNEYLGKKYGDRIRLVVPMLFPKLQTEEVSKEEKGSGEGKGKIHFDLKPEELEAFLDDYIIRQDEAKEILATKICTHFNRIKFTELTKGRNRYDDVGHIKNNILMIGPTGVGKTYLIKLIAKKIGVSFVKGDAKKFSETGHVGGMWRISFGILFTKPMGILNWLNTGLFTSMRLIRLPHPIISSVPMYRGQGFNGLCLNRWRRPR
jgi:ATP-dependent Clp protease ATP-binding subunit ClpX